MGNCNCSLDGNKQQQTQIKAEQTANPLINVNQEKQKTQNGQKKRAKVALLVNNNNQQVVDNVTFLPQQTITNNDLIEIKKTLKKHFIFSQLAQNQIDCFLNQLRPCKTEKGKYVFKQGDKSGSYYIILEGECQVEINNQKKRVLKFGDSFGDLGIVYSAPRSASVLTLSHCYFVEMNRNVFKKVMQDINSAYEQENKKFLGVLTFFKDLTEQQKNAIASTCLTETYEENQVIFSQGDAANSFYIIKEGTVTIKQKNIDLKQMQSFGENSIVEGGTRSNTLVAKTRCKIISMSRQNVQASLGGSVKSTLRKNMIAKIITESQFYKLNPNLQWKQALQKIEDLQLKKDENVFKKNQQFENVIYVNLSCKLSGQTIHYEANDIIELSQIMAQQNFTIHEDIKVCSQGYIGKVNINLQVDLKKSLQTKKSEEKEESKQALHIIAEKKMMITDFHVIKKLRAGNFGQVYACYNTKTQKIYAIKVLDRSYVEKAQIIQYVMNEEQILRTAPKHPFIVQFHKLIKDNNFLYFVMQYIEGEDLFDSITRMISFNQSSTKFLVSQILSALEHLHSHKIIYRDLKPENIMLCPNGYLKLVDMGTAKKLKIQKRYRTTTIIGTPHYMAPEIITGKGYSFSVDLWSLGVIMYELLCGKLPFGQYSDDPFTIYEQIINSTIKYPRNCQKNCKVFIEKLMSRNPQQRMGNGYEQLKRHAFLQGINWKQLLAKQIQPQYVYDYRNWITEAEIKVALKDQRNKIPKRMVTDRVVR